MYMADLCTRIEEKKIKIQTNYLIFSFSILLVIRDSQVLAKLGAIYSAFAAFKMVALSG